MCANYGSRTGVEQTTMRLHLKCPTMQYDEIMGSKFKGNYPAKRMKLNLPLPTPPHVHGQLTSLPVHVVTVHFLLHLHSTT